MSASPLFANWPARAPPLGAPLVRQQPPVCDAPQLALAQPSGQRQIGLPMRYAGSPAFAREIAKFVILACADFNAP